MLESKIQKKIIDKLEKMGWFVIKLIRTNKAGIPDLIAIKDGKCFFVEVKRPDMGVLSKLQEYRINELKQFGINTIVSTSIEDL